jgi:hypothetical protein
MSIRSLITTIAVAAALLAFPVVASARLADVGPLDVHAKAQPVVVASEAGSTGTGTATVVLIAGLTLLAGAATGIGAARAMQRRGRAVQA